MEFIRSTDKNGTPGDEIRSEIRILHDGTEFPLLVFPAIERTGLVKHGFTTRLGGVSEGIFASLNLGFSRGDDPEAVARNFRRTAEAIDADTGMIVCSHQTHTTNVRVVTEEDAGKGLTRPRDYSDVDGMITEVPGLVLATFFADCVPLFFVDPVHIAIGLSHSGWKGTAARMGARTLEAMGENYGTNPEEVICAVGPSICRNCYEVGGEVAEVFAREFEGHEKEILAPRNVPGKYLLDLWRANRIVLEEAGVMPEHISVTDICTCCNPELLFSHRASRGKRGNLGAFLSLI